MRIETVIKPVVQITVGAVIIFAITYIAGAFTEPTLAPPNGNVSPPIHTGTALQTKDGSLGIVGNFSVGGTGTFLNNIIIGNTSISENTPKFFQIDVADSGGAVPGTGAQYLGSDCDAAADIGKMFYDYRTKYLYICDNPAGATGAVWRRVFTTTP